MTTMPAMNTPSASVSAYRRAYPAATSCAVCGRTHEEAGGRRIAARYERGMLLLEAVEADEAAIHPGRQHPTRRGTILVEWGAWPAGTVARALREVEAGRHPWRCQRCAGYRCQRCGDALRETPGCDVVGSDGALTHYPARNENGGGECRSCSDS